MSDQPPSIVQTVVQTTEMSLRGTWNIWPNEQNKRLMVRFAWRTRTDNAQPTFRPLEFVQEEDAKMTQTS